MRPWEIVLAVVVIAGLVGVTIMFWRRRDRWEEWAHPAPSAGAIAWADWTLTARKLPLRDRWTLYWCSLRGEPVPEPRLAGLAVERAHAAHARLARRGWNWSIPGSFLVMVCGVGMILSGGRWWLGATYLMWGLGMLCLRLVPGWTPGLLERGAEANRRLLDSA